MDEESKLWLTPGNSYQEKAYASSTAIAVPLLPPEKAWKCAGSDTVIHCRGGYHPPALLFAKFSGFREQRSGAARDKPPSGREVDFA